MKKTKNIIKDKESKDTQAALLDILADAEEARKEAAGEREKTSAIINNFTDGLMILDKEGKIVKVNPWIENIFSLEAKEIEGKDIEVLKKNPLISKAVDLILDAEGIKEIIRTQFSPKENITFELTSISIISKGEKRGYLLIFHDISRQKAIESLKTEFVTLTAHQLRTPLSGIKWSLKMLLDGDIGELTKEQKEFILKVQKSNERMIKLINDLLDVTKIEEGRYLYYVKKEDIIKIAKEVIEPFNDRIKAKNLQFKFLKPKEKIPAIDLDKEKIAICIQNLLVNAINYTNPGGKVTITIKYDKKKKEIVLQVQDTGMGIPKAQQERIFAKFYRSTAAMKAETVGSGLGLYITQNIVKAHNGKIWFESEEGKGSTFYFSLPTEKKRIKKRE